MRVGCEPQDSSSGSSGPGTVWWCSATSEPLASSTNLQPAVILQATLQVATILTILHALISVHFIFISLQLYWSPFCRLQLLDWWRRIDLLAPSSLFPNERCNPRNPLSFSTHKLYLTMLLRPINRGTTTCHFAVRQPYLLKLFIH